MEKISESGSARNLGLELSFQLTGLPTRLEYLRAAGAVLLSLLPGDLTTWSTFDADSSTAEVVTWPGDGLASRCLAAELVAVADDHPMVISYLRGDPADMSPRRLSDVTTRSELLRTRAYAELLHPRGAEHQLTIVSGRISPAFARGWAVNRSTSDFTNEELTFARAIQPTLCLLDITGGTPHLPSEAQQEAASRLGLTPREVDVLHFLSEGLTVGAIARQLRISSRTVRKHLENSYRKLGCHDRLLAVTKARTVGLV